MIRTIGTAVKLLAIIIFIAFFSCKTAEFGYLVLTVNGMIYDFSNRPVPNCTVQIGEKYQAVSDINGRFFIPKIPADDYSITVTKEGYETFHGSVIVGDGKQIVYIRIPSFMQLLELADDALTKNQIREASAFVDRAISIGERTTELLFYAAVVAFRQQKYLEAKYLLVEAKQQGANDLYIDSFIQDLNQLLEAEDETSG
jgi:hypothetical protein